MQRKWDESVITFYLGDERDCEAIARQAPMEPFAGPVMDFLAALSAALREDEAARRMPDTAAFAFWCRGAHLKMLREEYAPDGVRRLGRGVSLHFAPANLPVLFAFSMAAGLLAGDCVILRLPQKETEQERIIRSAVEQLMETEFREMRGRIIFCRYGHEREVTEWLSSLCDVRVIWGADASVNEIRQTPLPARAVEIPFASRGSAAVLAASEVLRIDRLDVLARDFFNDTYRNDQNACSSPQMICWLGTKEEIGRAQERFWNALKEVLEEKQYEIGASLAVKKADAALMLAADFEGVRIRRHQNRIVRAEVPAFDRRMWEYTAPGGFFIESGGESLVCMRELFTARCQTLCVYGADPKETAAWLQAQRVRGADRIVPVGHAMDFSLTWDGFDLIEAMSRRISF